MPPKEVWTRSKTRVQVWAKWMQNVGEDQKRFVRREMRNYLPLVNSAEHQIVLASDDNGYFLTLVSATSRELRGVHEHAEAFASVNVNRGAENGTYYHVGSKSGVLTPVDVLDARGNDETTKEKSLPEYRSMGHFLLDQRPRYLPLGPAALYRGIWVEHLNGRERSSEQKQKYFREKAIKIAESDLDNFLGRGLFEAGEDWRTQDTFLNKFISSSQKAHLARFFKVPPRTVDLRFLSLRTTKTVARVVCALKGCPFVFVDTAGVVWFLSQDGEDCESAFRTQNGDYTVWSVRQFLFWIMWTQDRKHELVWNRFVHEFVALTLRGQSMLDNQSLDTMVVCVKGDHMGIKFLHLPLNDTTWGDEFKELKNNLPSNSAITRGDLMDVFKMPLRNTDSKPPSMLFDGEDAGFVPPSHSPSPMHKRPSMRRLQRISADDLQHIATRAVQTHKAEIQRTGEEAKDDEAKDAQEAHSEDGQVVVNTNTLLGLGTNGAVYAVNDFALKVSLVNNDHEHPNKKKRWENELKVAKMAAGDGQSGPGPGYLSGGIVRIGADDIGFNHIGFVLMERMQTSLRKAVETIHYPLQWAIELIKALNSAAKKKLVCTDLHLGNWMVNLRNGNITKMRMIDFGECNECTLGGGFDQDTYLIKNVEFKEKHIIPVIELYSLVHFLSSCQIVLWNDMWSPGVLVALKRVNALVRTLQSDKFKEIGRSETFLVDKIKKALQHGNHNPLVHWVLGTERGGVRKTPVAAVEKVSTAFFGFVTEFNELAQFISAVFDEKTIKILEKKNKKS